METIAGTPEWKDKISEGQDIDEQTVMNIYKEYHNTERTQMQLAYRYNTSQGTVSNIVNGVHHSDITGANKNE